MQSTVNTDNTNEKKTPLVIVNAATLLIGGGIQVGLSFIEHASRLKSGQLESSERSWKPGESDEKGIAFCAEIFADVLHGHELVANNSRWIRFATLRARSWRDGNVLLIGDAAHTAQFSIGSGTKLAMEDALALAACLHENPTVDEALVAYESIHTRAVQEASGTGTHLAWCLGRRCWQVLSREALV